jgi:hypothetical protein
LSEIYTTIHLRGSKDQLLTLEFRPYQDGVNLRLEGATSICTVAGFHLADILTAVCLGEDHYPGLPDYCCCPQCRETRGEALAQKIADIQWRRQLEEENKSE